MGEAFEMETGMLENILIIAYLGTLGLLAVYGFHRSHLVYLFYSTRRKTPHPKAQFKELPFVTIQLPMFNERYVASRLIEAIANVDYPKDRYEIQVLDDSTDDTTEIAQKKVDEVAARGINAYLIHRTDRTGFKAGSGWAPGPTLGTTGPGMEAGRTSRTGGRCGAPATGPAG